MSKEIKRVSFEVEHYNGMTYMGFELSIKDDGTVDVIKTNNCSLADVDGDYIFNTENSLYRIQADEPISESEFEEIQDCAENHDGNEIVYKSDLIVVKKFNNPDSGCIATIENKAQKNLLITFQKEEFKDVSFLIPGNSTIGINIYNIYNAHSILKEIINDRINVM